MVEETGEVSAELRKKLQLSFNPNKVDSFQDVDLQEELVDILITWYLLCKSLDIDSLDEAVVKKIDKNY